MRCAAYVDGLNLYHGMEDAKLLRYRWLDIHRACELVLGDVAKTVGIEEGIELVDLTYCTSLVIDKQARSRQEVYLAALERHRPSIQILKGSYGETTQDCTKCTTPVSFAKEKQTDVNLALALVMGAMADEPPDMQLLMTGDTDLVPAIRLARTTGSMVVVAAPPNRGRTKATMEEEADHFFHVAKQHLKFAPLPGAVSGADPDYPLTPPGTWAHPDDW